MSDAWATGHSLLVTRHSQPDAGIEPATRAWHAPVIPLHQSGVVPSFGLRRAQTVSRRGGADCPPRAIGPLKTNKKSPEAVSGLRGQKSFALPLQDHQLVSPTPAAVPCWVFGAQTIAPAFEAAAVEWGWANSTVMCLAVTDATVLLHIGQFATSQTENIEVETNTASNRRQKD